MNQALDQSKKKKVETTTRRIQTTLHVTNDSKAKVRCERGVQTATTVGPTANNNDIINQLEYVPYQLISKNCIKQFDLPRRAYLHWKFSILPPNSSVSSLPPKSALKRELLSHESLSDITSIGRYRLYPPRKMMKTEDEEVQTNLRVFPHILDAREIANVAAEIATQTSITCVPEESITNILDMLKGNLRHKETSSFDDNEDAAEEQRDEYVDNIYFDGKSDSYTDDSSLSTRKSLLQKPNDIKSLFSNILEGNCKTAALKYKKTYNEQKLIDAFETIGEILHKELQNDTNKKVNLKNLQEALNESFGEKEQDPLQILPQKTESCTCKSKNDKAPLYSLSDLNEKVVRLSNFYENEHLSGNFIAEGASNVNFFHPHSSCKIEKNRSHKSDDEYKKSFTLDQCNCTSCNKDPTGPLVVPAVFSKYGFSQSKKTKCYAHCNNIGNVTNPLFMCQDDLKYNEPYMEELFAVSQEIQTDLTLGESLHSESLNSIIYNAVTNQSTNAEMQLPWDLITLPEVKYKSKETREKRLLKNDSKLKNEIIKKSRSKRPKVDKLLHEMEVQKQCEPYMESLNRTYTDSDEEMGDCGSQTEIPWKDLLLPVNYTIRKMRKKKKTSCRCNPTKKIKNTDDTKVNPKGGKIQEVDRITSSYSTNSEFERKARKSPKTFTLLLNLGENEKLTSKNQITPSKLTNSSIETAISYLPSSVIINLKPSTTCEYNSEIISVDKASKKDSVLLKVTNFQNNDSCKSISLSDISDEANNSSKLKASSVKLNLNYTSTSKNCKTESSVQCSLNQKSTRYKSNLKTTIESYQNEMKPLYEKLNQIQSKMQGIDLDTFRYCDKLFNYQSNRIRNKIYLKNGFSGTVRTTIKYHPQFDRKNPLIFQCPMVNLPHSGVNYLCTCGQHNLNPSKVNSNNNYSYCSPNSYCNKDASTITDIVAPKTEKNCKCPLMETIRGLSLQKLISKQISHCDNQSKSCKTIRKSDGSPSDFVQETDTQEELCSRQGFSKDFLPRCKSAPQFSRSKPTCVLFRSDKS